MDKALINLGGRLIGFFEISETNNNIFFFLNLDKLSARRF